MAIKYSLMDTFENDNEEFKTLTIPFRAETS